MPYIKRTLTIANGEKAYEILLKCGFDMPLSQRLIDRGRVFCDDIMVGEKNSILNGQISLIEYECKPKGLKPIFECSDFVAFDKPSGVLSHPSGRNTLYSLYDEIWSCYSRRACVAHRLDRETSGVIIVALNSAVSNKIKSLFESRVVKKRYYALVEGLFDSDKFIVDLPIEKSVNDEVKIRMQVGGNKRALTEFRVVKEYKNIGDSGATLLECCPQTGRQHQIRLHLFHVKHRIIGDPLYGVSKEIAEAVMDSKISTDERIKSTGANRLLLHASEIEFVYLDKNYLIKSAVDVEGEFMQALR